MNTLVDENKSVLNCEIKLMLNFK